MRVEDGGVGRAREPGDEVGAEDVEGGLFELYDAGGAPVQSQFPGVERRVLPYVATGNVPSSPYKQPPLPLSESETQPCFSSSDTTEQTEERSVTLRHRDPDHQYAASQHDARDAYDLDERSAPFLTDSVFQRSALTVKRSGDVPFAPA